MKMKLSHLNLPKRHIIVIMALIGYANKLYLHTNLSMVVVDITTMKNITHLNSTTELKADFNWSSMQKGVILSSLGYGRMLSPIGGLLAGRFGGSTTYSLGILVVSLITFFNPFFLRYHMYLFIAATIIHGASETFAYASLTQIYSRWIPPNERTRVISFACIGGSLGCMGSFLVSGWILSTYTWEVLYYISGVVTFVWFILWSTVVKNDPSEDKYITEEERNYIQKTINSNSVHEKLVYPWKEILKCVPFWACCLAKFAAGCGHIFTVANLPQYIKDFNDTDIKKIGYISTIPHIGSLGALILVGFLGDYLRSHNTLSVTNTHKLLISMSLFPAAVIYLVIVLCPNFYIDIVALSAILFFGIFTMIDALVVFLDLAPKYAAFLHSVANIFYSSAGVVVPTMVGFIVTSHSLFQWNICFVILSGVHLLPGLIYLKFGSGELRSWANYSPTDRKTPTDEEIEK